MSSQELLGEVYGAFIRLRNNMFNTCGRELLSCLQPCLGEHSQVHRTLTTRKIAHSKGCDPKDIALAKRLPRTAHSNTKTGTQPISAFIRTARLFPHRSACYLRKRLFADRPACHVKTLKYGQTPGAEYAAYPSEDCAYI